MQMAGIFAHAVLPVSCGAWSRAAHVIGAVLALASIALMGLQRRLESVSTAWPWGRTVHDVDDRRDLAQPRIRRPESRPHDQCLHVAVCRGLGGPFILAEVGSQGATPFVTTAIMIGFIILPLVVARGIRIAPGERPSASLHQYVRLAPVPMVANLMFGMIGSTFMALLAVYGLRLGMDEALSARMLGWQGWGGAAMTFLLAWLASRFDRTLLLAVCTAAGALASLLLPWIPEMRSVGTPGIPWIDDIGGVLLISYLMIFGGVRAAHYGIAIMLVGDRFRGADLPSATTVFGLMFCSGSILGPALGGLAMDLWDPHGLAGAVFLFHLLLLPLPLVTWWRRRAVSNPRRG